MPKLLRKKIQATYGENASKRLRKRLAQNTSHSVSNANWYQSAEELLRMRVDRHYLKVKEVSLPNHVSKQLFYLKAKTIKMSMHTRIWHLPRSQTSLSLRKGGRAREGGKGKGCETSGRFCFQDEECPMADDYAIFKKEHRPVRFTNFEGKVVFPHPVCQEEAVFRQLNGLQHHYRIRHLAVLSMPKNYRKNRLWSARTKKSCTAMLFAMYLVVIKSHPFYEKLS